MVALASTASTRPSETVDRAESFLAEHGRLLERRMFATWFRGAPRGPALAVLRTYQNDDGGFGWGLLPEFRSRESSLRQTAAALEILDALDALHDASLEGVFKFLTRTPPELGPIAHIAGLLAKHGFVHPWLEQATEYCWRVLSLYADPPAGLVGEPPSFATLYPALLFLAYNDPDATPVEGAAALRRRIETLILEWDLVTFDAEHSPDGQSPLDWAPGSMSPGMRLFTISQIERHLQALPGRQLADGGWPAITSGSNRSEARSLQTLRALQTLRSYARV